MSGLDASVGFVPLMGLHIDELTATRVRGHLDIDARHLQPHGVVHGGVYCAVGETLASVGAHLAAVQRDPAHSAVGLENHTSFLRAVGAGTRVTAEATVRHGGRRVQHWTVTMLDQQGRELAVSTVRLLVVATAEVST